ncbi:MAG: CRISPR-associated helicase Cas3' [Campylobacteraceae bacterium]|jgi:CRISPR-associated endonuclease/helicase Cas3|nr:CRISPR-associated helicase Cas3' [Campylobacteraceae bacterium]
MLNFNSHPNINIETHIRNMNQDDDNELALRVKYFHDLGKASEEFQKKLCGEKHRNYSHATESAILFFIMSHDRINTNDIIAALLAIWCHHTSLKDAKKIFKNDDNSEIVTLAIERLKEENTFDNLPAEYTDRLENLKSIEGDLSRYLLKQIRKFGDKIFSIKDTIEQRFLFSNLVFNDKYSAITGEKFNFPNTNFEEIFKKYIANKYSSSKLNIRDEFRNSVLKNYSNNKNSKIFVINAPTGISKTLTSFALAEQIGKKIIFAPPVTAIIDQVFDDISKICADKIKLTKIHHKTFTDIDEDDENKELYNKEKFLSEMLNGEIIITTQWQIMSAIFSNKNSDCAKMYSLKNSTVIIDEMQALPYQIINTVERYFMTLSEQYNISFILMSATMPHFKTTNFCALSENRFFNCYNRYKLEWLQNTKMHADAMEENKNILIKSIIKSTKNSNKILVVLNQIASAQEIFIALKEQKKLGSYEILSLTTYMMEEHRNKVIQYIKNASKKQKIILVSTQSIEAGVDLDFDVGFREAAPISSIIQTAGRVNRHGLNKIEEIRTLFVFGIISEYTNKIYGDQFTVSIAYLKKLIEQKTIFEKDILTIVESYFKELPPDNSQEMNSHISNAAHQKIHQEIFEKYIEIDDFKKSLYIATEKNEKCCLEIIELQQEKMAFKKNQNRDRFFEINEKIDLLFKKYLAPNIIKISKQDITNASSFDKYYNSKMPFYADIYVMNEEFYNVDMGIIKKGVLEKFPDKVSDISVS